MKVLSISEALEKLSLKIQGSGARKSGQSKIELAKIFGNSKSFYYDFGKETPEGETPKALIVSDRKSGKSYLCKVTHVADQTI